MKTQIIVVLFVVTTSVTIVPKSHSVDPVNFITVPIIATNDIHGSVFPIILNRADTNQRYRQGGLTVLGSMIDSIRQEYGKDNVLFLDSGDQFQGGI